MKTFRKPLATLAFVSVLVFGLAGPALAVTTVDLGTADGFAVLGATAVTNVPNSAIIGDVGLSPAAGSNYSGITQAQVIGTIYAVDGTGPAGSVNNPGLLTQAQNDLTAAYVDAAGRTPSQTFVAADNQLGGQILGAGVYAFGHASTANIVGTLTLTGNANAVFIFQASSDLVTASSSVVQLTGGAQSCNVFWVVGSSTTLGSSSTFVGTIMSLTATGLNSGVTLDGRALARNAATTLNQDTITRSACTIPSGSGGTTVGSAVGSGSGLSDTTPGFPHAGFGPGN